MEWKDINFEYEYSNSGFKPGERLHDNLVREVLTRADSAFSNISARHRIWRDIDDNLRLFKRQDIEEKDIKKDDDRKPTSIVFPYSYAILTTLLSYMSAALLKDPLFKYTGVSAEDQVGAMLMTQVVDRQNKKFRNKLNLITMLRDSLVYGFGIIVPSWTVQTRTLRSLDGGLSETIAFEGNEIQNIDPYLALPDPNVPIHELQQGEFFGWVEKTNFMDLLTREQIGDSYFNGRYTQQVADGRSRYSGRKGTQVKITNNLRPVDVINLVVKLIPKEWNLGEADLPEKWIFSVAGDSLLIRAEPLGLDHSLFPVIVAAPEYDGYDNPISKIESLGGLQHLLDWLLNSHIRAVRKSVNDVLVVDPQAVNIKDVENIGKMGGGIIRLRRYAFGKGVKDFVSQLPISDVTRGNVADASTIIEMMHKIAGASDASMGVLRQGGPERLTAGEADQSARGLFTRLDQMVEIVHLQAIIPLGEIFASNTQQFMSQKMFLRINGRLREDLMKEYGIPTEHLPDEYHIDPSDLLINYDLEINPAKQDSSQILMQMLGMISQHPELQRYFDVARLVKHILRQNGETNVEDFVRIVEDNQVNQMQQEGQIVPMTENGGIDGFTGGDQGVPEQPVF